MKTQYWQFSMAVDFVIVMTVIKNVYQFSRVFEGHGDVKILRDQQYRSPLKRRVKPDNPITMTRWAPLNFSTIEGKLFQNDFMFDLLTGYLVEIFQLTSVSWFCLLPIFRENHLEFSVSIICKDSTFKIYPLLF